VGAGDRFLVTLAICSITFSGPLKEWAKGLANVLDEEGYSKGINSVYVELHLATTWFELPFCPSVYSRLHGLQYQERYAPGNDIRYVITVHRSTPYFAPQFGGRYIGKLREKTPDLTKTRSVAQIGFGRIQLTYGGSFAADTCKTAEWKALLRHPLKAIGSSVSICLR
jgi:hypothetical protein